MFNLKIPINESNIEILFANALVENLRYGIITLDAMFDMKFEGKLADIFYGDKHTFYFYCMQSVLTAQGNIWNTLFKGCTKSRTISDRTVTLIKVFNVDIKDYPLLNDKNFRNTNEHFDERYYEHDLVVGDYNIIDSETDENTKNEILSTKHLRTIDIVNWKYISYGKKHEKITLDLKQLRDEMYQLLSNLCNYDVRTQRTMKLEGALE